VSTQVPTVLQRILAETRAEVERRKREAPALELPGADTPPARSFARALRGEAVSVIAEFKRRSPSAGTLRADASLEQVLGAYERGGAAAVSVLTEQPNFGGSLEDLSAARRACALPLLRKDFIVDGYQLQEARAAGADAVLLIVAALAPSQMAELHAQAGALGLDVLVEVHDEQELASAVDVGARIIGVNNRDLRDFSVDTQRTERLMDAMPADVTVVSESGIRSAEQLQRLGELGVAAVLVGELLMAAADPALALSELRSLNPSSQDL
jgi:indole-3-glycerol phosphate synthase